jgi:hypothetical protein
MFNCRWFDGRQAKQTLPPECVSDCTGPGPADSAVDYWIDELEFDGPAWLFRDYLKGFGAWDKSELCDHNQNRKRVLWIWAGNCAEDPDNYLYLE